MGPRCGWETVENFEPSPIYVGSSDPLRDDQHKSPSGAGLGEVFRKPLLDYYGAIFFMVRLSCFAVALSCLLALSSALPVDSPCFSCRCTPINPVIASLLDDPSARDVRERNPLHGPISGGFGGEKRRRVQDPHAGRNHHSSGRILVFLFWFPGVVSSRLRLTTWWCTSHVLR